MSPLPLGILAASAAGGATFEHIQTTLVSGSAASVTFSGLAALASNYKHLQIRGSFRHGSNDTTLVGRFNGSGTGRTGYSMFTSGAGEIPPGERSASDALGLIYTQDAGSSPANAFTSVIIDLPDCFETDKFKSVAGYIGLAGSGTNHNRIGFFSNVWENTAATTSFGLSLGTGAGPAWQGSSFQGNTRFSLFGIRGG